MPEVTNWLGDLISDPAVIVDANSVDDIITFFKDSTEYLSPVRAVGSDHSTTPCGVADGGTLIGVR
jgi:FAD/FMN-containing dehydrogenase